jgi:tetratricopeptide (TPR) repeat protein
MQGYTVRDVARMLDLSVGQVRSYARAGFIEPMRGPRGEYRFSFQDLVLLRTAKGLEAGSIPPRRLRNALRRLKRALPSGHPLTSVRIQARGERIAVHEGDSIWDAESGQSAFNFEVAELVEKAAPHAKRAIERAREAEEPLDADDWYELGFDLESSAPDHAREAYRQSLELDPANVDARVNLGRLLLVCGDLEAAETQFRLALAGDGPNATAWFNLGVVLEDRKRIEEATRAYREAIKVDPDYGDAYFNLARLCEQNGDAQAALRYLKAYRELNKGG